MTFVLIVAVSATSLFSISPFLPPLSYPSTDVSTFWASSPPA